MEQEVFTTLHEGRREEKPHFPFYAESLARVLLVPFLFGL